MTTPFLLKRFEQEFPVKIVRKKMNLKNESIKKMDKKNPIVQCDSWIQSYCDKIHESFRFLPFFLLKSLSITCTTKPVSG